MTNHDFEITGLPTYRHNALSLEQATQGEQLWRRSILNALHDIRSQHPERERGEAAGDVGLNGHNSQDLAPSSPDDVSVHKCTFSREAAHDHA